MGIFNYQNILLIKVIYFHCFGGDMKLNSTYLNKAYNYFSRKLLRLKEKDTVSTIKISQGLPALDVQNTSSDLVSSPKRSHKKPYSLPIDLSKLKEEINEKKNSPTSVLPNHSEDRIHLSFPSPLVSSLEFDVEPKQNLEVSKTEFNLPGTPFPSDSESDLENASSTQSSARVSSAHLNSTKASVSSHPPSKYLLQEANDIIPAKNEPLGNQVNSREFYHKFSTKFQQVSKDSQYQSLALPKSFSKDFFELQPNADIHINMQEYLRSVLEYNFTDLKLDEILEKFDVEFILDELKNKNDNQKIMHFIECAQKFKADNISIQDAILNQLIFRTKDKTLRNKLINFQINDELRKAQGLNKLGLTETDFEKHLKLAFSLMDAAANPTQEVLQAASIFTLAQIGAAGAGLATGAGVLEAASKEMPVIQKAMASTETSIQLYNFIHYFVAQDHPIANTHFEEMFKIFAKHSSGSKEVDSYNQLAQQVSNVKTEETSSVALQENLTEALAQGTALTAVALTGFVLHMAGAIKHMDAAVSAFRKANKCSKLLEILKNTKGTTLKSESPIDIELSGTQTNQIATQKDQSNQSSSLETSWKSFFRLSSSRTKYRYRNTEDLDKKIEALKIKYLPSSVLNSSSSEITTIEQLKRAIQQQPKNLFNRYSLYRDKKVLLAKLRNNVSLDTSVKENAKHFLGFQISHQKLLGRLEGLQSFFSVGAATGAAASFFSGLGIPLMLACSAAKLTLALPEAVMLAKKRSLLLSNKMFEFMNDKFSKESKDAFTELEIRKIKDNLLDANATDGTLKLKRSFYTWHGLSLSDNKVLKKLKDLQINDDYKQKALLEIFKTHSKSANELKQKMIVDLAVDLTQHSKEQAVGRVAHISDEAALKLLDKEDDLFKGGFLEEGAFAPKKESADKDIMEENVRAILVNKQGFNPIKVWYNIRPKANLRKRAELLNAKLKFKDSDESSKKNTHRDNWTRFVPRGYQCLKSLDCKNLIQDYGSHLKLLGFKDVSDLIDRVETFCHTDPTELRKPKTSQALESSKTFDIVLGVACKKLNIEKAELSKRVKAAAVKDLQQEFDAAQKRLVQQSTLNKFKAAVDVEIARAKLERCKKEFSPSTDQLFFQALSGKFEDMKQVQDKELRTQMVMKILALTDVLEKI